MDKNVSRFVMLPCIDHAYTGVKNMLKDNWLKLSIRNSFSMLIFEQLTWSNFIVAAYDKEQNTNDEKIDRFVSDNSKETKQYITEGEIAMHGRLLKFTKQVGDFENVNVQFSFQNRSFTLFDLQDNN